MKMLSSQEYLQHHQISISNAQQFGWLVRRNIGVSNLNIDAKFKVDECIARYFFTWGENISQIKIDEDASGDVYLIPMHCRKLKSVWFNSSEIGTVLRDILCYNPSLEEVAFEDVTVPSRLWKDVTLPKIKTLQISDIHHLSKRSCQAVGRVCEGLTQLRLSSLGLSSPDSIWDITILSKDLKSLDLSATNVNGTTISAIAQWNTRIVNLSLRDCDEIDDLSIWSIAQHLRELRTLDIRGCMALTDESLNHLSEFCAEQLVELFLDLDIFHAVPIAALLCKCTSLRAFGLEFTRDVVFTGEDLNDVFKALQTIERLHLHGARLISDTVLILAGRYCKCLTHIQLQPIEGPTTPDPAVAVYVTTAGLFALFDGCPQLLRLIVYEECPLLRQDLAIMMWKAVRKGLKNTCDESIDYDAMKRDV